MNKKNNMLKAVVAMVALVFILPGSAMFAEEIEDERQVVIGIPITLTNIASVEAEKESISPMQFPTTHQQTLDVDFPVFSAENDCQNPGIVTDGLGNILVLTEDVADVSTTNIWGRWSTDGGENWVDEGSIYGWYVNDAVERPKLDYKDGMTAWGTVTPGPDVDADTNYLDFPDITDPTVPSPSSPDGWTVWHVDWGKKGFSDFDSADVACYPYTPGTSPNANFFGCVANTGDKSTGDMAEDDAFMFSFLLENDYIQLIYFYNMNEDVDKITCDIDRSLGQFYMAMEYINETDPMDNGSLFIKGPIFDGTDNWFYGSYYGFTFSGISNPDIVAADGSVYIVGETESDIVCLYSSNAGASFGSSNVTDTVENESYPTVAIVEDEIICSYIRDGDLYVSISTDGVQTWTETVDPINDETGTVVDQYCSVAMDGPYAAWTDARNNPTEIYFDTTTSPPPPPPLPILNITEVKGGLGVSADIKNNGTADATDVEWSITVTGGMLGFIDKEFNGVISSIAVGDSATAESGMFLGFGKISVTVTAECAEGSSDEATADGKQIIIFTLI